MVSGSPVTGGICTQARAFLPPVAPLFPVYPGTRFATVPGGTCIRGAGAFLFGCQCSPGCPLRCGLSGNPAPVYPGGGSGLSGTGNPAPREPVSPGYRGLPPGNNSIAPLFFAIFRWFSYSTPYNPPIIPPSSPFWRVLLSSRNVSAFNCKSVTNTTFKTPESPKIHDSIVNTNLTKIMKKCRKT